MNDTLTPEEIAAEEKSAATYRRQNALGLAVNNSVIGSPIGEIIAKAQAFIDFMENTAA